MFLLFFILSKYGLSLLVFLSVILMKRLLFFIIYCLSSVCLTTVSGQTDSSVVSAEDGCSHVADTSARPPLSLASLPRPLVPSEALGSETYGVVTLSVASMRTEGRYPAELATQALLGTPVRILEERDGGWLRIQTPDNYTGFTKADNIKRMDSAVFAEWSAAPKIIFLAHHGFAYAQAKKNAFPVSDLVAGNILRFDGKSGSFYRIVYPDGRKAFVRQSEAKLLEQWQKDMRLTSESVLATARSFMGVPYLWGGTSPKAMDCSGFVKTVFFLHGLILQRDASQQCVTGEQVDITDGYAHLRPGDLLFFGKSRDRIRHVGIYMGNGEFIHEATQVKIGSLNPRASNYDELNTSEFVRACRIIDARELPGITTLDGNMYYQRPEQKKE